ncbi:MAG: hypothetical protein A3H98_08975 [Bacteroidetes bacterium RIFCSPLOWO2_02_FULL_36_8]|nr:MAG: hypothetical protein A3H98_08975 [Bacteroidetes bacterium RIFCSPLOWO2_02_FULL_36_8]
MEKTTSVNLSGLNFQMEEPGYKKLNEYLNSVRKQFSGYDDHEEIIRDIENRIAEMFTSKLSQSKNVITLDEVEEVISVMGNPSDFSAGSEETKKPESESQKDSAGKSRRMYRDEDQKVIGGVAAGVANYFGLDPVWLRLAFFFSVFFGGFGALLYIVLWIALPKPKTLSERLEMKGNPVNLSSIENALKKNLPENKPGEENVFTKFLLFPFRLIAQLLEGLLKIVNSIFKSLTGVFRWIGGLLILFISFALFVAISFGLAICFGIFYSLDIPFFNLAGGWVQAIGFLSVYFLVGIPLIFIFLTGISLLRKKWSINTFSGLTMLSLWFMALVSFIVVSATIVPDFSARGVLVNSNQYSTNATSGWMLKASGEGNRNYFNSSLTIKPFKGEKTELTIKKFSRGKTIKDAREKAGNILYNVTQQDSMLTFDSNFSLPENQLFRRQRLEAILKVPFGKSIFIDETLSGLLDEVPNSDGFEAEEMAGFHWEAKEDGFHCLDCPETIINEKQHEDLKEKIEILQKKVSRFKKGIRKAKNKIKNADSIKDQLDEMETRLDDFEEEYEEGNAYPELKAGLDELKKELEEMKDNLPGTVTISDGEGHVSINITDKGIRINAKDKKGKKGKIMIGDSVILKID